MFEIYDNNINYYYYRPGSNIIILHFKLMTHTVVIITHYKCMGYEIIPKPNFSGRESINSRCRFDLLLFRHFDSICGCYDGSCNRLGYHRWVAGDQLLINQSYCQSGCCHFDGSLAINWTLVRCLGFCMCFWVIFANEKMTRPKWDANAREEGTTVGMNSLRSLPRLSSNNCDL